MLENGAEVSEVRDRFWPTDDNGNPIEPSPPAAVEGPGRVDSDASAQAQKFLDRSEDRHKAFASLARERCPQCGQTTNPPSGFRCAHPWHDTTPAQEQPASPKLGPVDALRAEIVAALRKVSQGSGNTTHRLYSELADELERGGNERG